MTVRPVGELNGGVRGREPDLRLLLVRLSGSEYALPLERVVEVLRMVAVTAVVDAPAWVAGVVNLRGTIIQMVDLRVRLGLGETEPDPAAAEPDPSAMFVVACLSDRPVGLIVDRAIDVVTVKPSAIERPGELAPTGGLTRGVARVGDRLVVLLDLGQLEIALREVGDAAGLTRLDC